MKCTLHSSHHAHRQWILHILLALVAVLDTLVYMILQPLMLPPNKRDYMEQAMCLQAVGQQVFQLSPPSQPKS